MESITGTIENVFYHQISSNSDSGNKYIVAKFTYEKDGKISQTSISGEMNTPVYGWKYNLFGEWKTHPKYGLGFTSGLASGP